MKKVLLYLLSGILILILLIGCIGLLLPKERVESRQTTFNATPETIYNIVTNNNDWKYRSGLKDLKIIRRNGEKETWEETTDDGAVIQFITRKKIPFNFYSFDMESKLFTGYWTAEFKPVGNEKTLFTATEYIRIKNPFVKTLSYLFFDIGKLMEVYQQDLENKINKAQ